MDWLLRAIIAMALAPFVILEVLPPEQQHDTVWVSAHAYDDGHDHYCERDFMCVVPEVPACMPVDDDRVFAWYNIYHFMRQHIDEATVAADSDWSYDWYYDHALAEWRPLMIA